MKDYERVRQFCIECGKEFPLRGSSHFAMNLCQKCGDSLNGLKIVPVLLKKTVQK